jgi:hypothetical protein
MKSDESRTPTRHQLDHALPPVLHHPDETEPVLRRWITDAMENQARFWGIIGTVVAGLILIVVLYSSFSGAQSATDAAWTKLESAKSASERVEIAKDYPKTPAALAALLQAATEFYNQGLAGLPSDRDVAEPTLRKAGDLFEQVATEAPPDSAQARVAALGVARSLEARNHLDKAIKQYEKVAGNKAWAGTDEAKEANRLAKLLSRPESVAFYKSLYAYKPAEATLSPGGIDRLNFPMPFDSPLRGAGPGRTSLPFDLRDLPPPPSPFETKNQPELPADVFAPPVAAPKDVPKLTPPAPVPAPAPK